MHRLVVALAACLPISVANPVAAERPNVLFILTDDQGPWALGLAGLSDAKTPHLDRLFREGAYLVNAFTVTPVCSPSRASLMTGRYGSELGITDWIRPDTEPELGLTPGTVTWPQLLKQAGYRTALIGKWHLGTQDRYHPAVFGYEFFMGFRGGGTKLKDPPLEMDGQARVVRGFTSDILTDEAVRWLRLHDSERGPFALSLHFRSPHAPWLPLREEDRRHFENLDPAVPNPDFPGLDVARVKKSTREYLGSVAEVDRNVGRLMRELELLGLDRNTVVIFSSDHGYNIGHHGVLHKGNGHWIVTDPPPGTANVPAGQRPNMFDTSLRVPTAVRWPGVIEPGSVVHHTVSNLDWFPTLLEIAGVPRPDGVPVRGRSIVPLLQGAAPDWNDDLYAVYSTHHTSRTHMRVYRTAEWKLIRDLLNPERDELYNLKHDPGETKNLIAADDPPARKAMKELHARIIERMRAIDDPVLDIVRTDR